MECGILLGRNQYYNFRAASAASDKYHVCVSNGVFGFFGNEKERTDVHWSGDSQRRSNYHKSNTGDVMQHQ